MASARKALLIASPYRGLHGTLNDASRIQEVLEKHGFVVNTCLGPRGTRAGIYDAWQQLTSTTDTNDTIVIYYSGHGCMVESALEKDRTDKDWRYQFLVPVDFDISTEGDFRGILDVEISHLLRKLTDRTPNVTILLDCCHSGRMARAPAHGDRAAPRWIAPVTYDDVAAFRDRHLQRVFVEDQKGLGTGFFCEENPNVVRVVAAAASETAWEYQGADGLWRGAFTEALARVLEDTHGKNIPWKTSLLRLQELVHSRFPSQHPHVEGPETRVPFLMQRVESEAIHLKMEDGMPVLQAGRMSCVHEGNIYSVLDLDSEEASMTREIAECEVEAASLFQALGRLRYSPKIHSLPPEGALAFLKRSALYKWPIKASPETLIVIGDALSESSFLRNSDPTEYEEAILEITFEDPFVAVLSAHGHRVAMRYLNPEDSSQSTDVCKAIIFDAERLARAQHFLALRNEHHQEQLVHRVAIQIGLVEDRRPGKMLLGSGTDRVRTHDRVYVDLSNDGAKTVYVNILYANVQGKISLISRSSPLGIEIPPGRSHCVGKNRFGILEGLKVSWPSDMSQALPINESLIIMLTQYPLDMRPLETPGRPPPVSRASLTALDSAMLQLSHGHRRDVTLDQEQESNAFEMIHFPLTVEPEEQASRPGNFHEIAKDKNDTSISGDDLPFPEMLTEGQELLKLPPQVAPYQRGILGALSRTVRRIPSCVWVVNEHSEEIIVVISQYRPSRLLSGADLNASASGAGLSFSTTTFTYPATRKTLSAATQGLEASTGVFPLWTRRDGFGVVTIYKGSGRDLFIENDRIPLGSTVYFHNTPDLRVVEYDSVKHS